MKQIHTFLLCFSFFFIFIKTNGQLKNLSDFKIGKQEGKYDGKYFIFKINNEKYRTDFRSIFLSKNEEVFKNITEKIIHFMIYENTYLFIGYFPNTQEQILSSIGYELRSLDKVTVVNLKNITEKWNYNLNNKTSLSNIISFNPNTGELIYSNPTKIYPN